MASPKAPCWALIFVIRIRFPPGTSLTINSWKQKNVKGNNYLKDNSPTLLIRLIKTQQKFHSLLKRQHKIQDFEQRLFCIRKAKFHFLFDKTRYQKRSSSFKIEFASTLFYPAYKNCLTLQSKPWTSSIGLLKNGAIMFTRMQHY